MFDVLVDACCPIGWRKFEDSCYYIYSDEKSWEQSREQCRSMVNGSDLVVINSKEEQVSVSLSVCASRQIDHIIVVVGLADCLTDWMRLC